MEIFFDGDLVKTAFKNILLDYFKKKACPGLAKMVANKMLL